jgi:hypothetical protein
MVLRDKFAFILFQWYTNNSNITLCT